MPIKQPEEPKISSNLADVSEESSSTLRAAGIFPIDSDGTVKTLISKGIFLLNPSTWTENKSANWVQHQTPGQSDPILQWMSSGPRTVNFTALVTKDTSNFVSATEPASETNGGDIFEQAKSVIGGIASSFAKTSVKPGRVTTGKTKTSDISGYLDYYRSLLYPLYDNKANPKRLTQSPPLVVLFNGSAINKFKAGTKISSQHDMWVVTNLQIRITKQAPNLAPLEAEVDFTLMQYTIKSFSSNRFFGGK
jgi:hypothetical protein